MIDALETVMQCTYTNLVS